MFWLELDPNIVKPGWTPFLITIGLAAVMYLLFRSMRRQFRRVDANYAPPAEEDATEQAEGREAEPTGTASAAAEPDSGRRPS